MRNVRLIIFVVFSFLTAFQLIALFTGLRSGSQGRADFRQLYIAGYMARTGQGTDLYNYGLEEQLQNKIVSQGAPLPFDHLAYEALLFVPFSFLNYSAAYFAFAGFNLCLLISTQWLFRPYLKPLESLGKFVPEAIFYCFLPVAVTIVLGQDSIVLLWLAALAFISFERGHDRRAGFLLSLGLFKFQYILPIVLLFLLWRKWRFVLGATIGGFIVVCLSTLIGGLPGMKAFASTMVEMSVRLNTQAQQLKFGTHPSAMPNLRGFIEAVAGSHFSSQAIPIAVLAGTLLVILFAARMRPSFSLAILVAVLVSYHSLIHDSSLLALPLGMVLVRAVSEENLLLGIIDMLLFACPALLLLFFHGRFFPMAILILTIILLQRKASGGASKIGLPA
jgi:hypothetical protein